MYDERIEGLINAALADGELTEKEKQILFKNAQAQGIDLDEFEMVLTARLAEARKRMGKDSTANKPAKKDNGVRKCPSCGGVLESFATRCPYCGAEIRTTQVAGSMEKFTEELASLDSMKLDYDGEEKKKIGCLTIILWILFYWILIPYHIIRICLAAYRDPDFDGVDKRKQDFILNAPVPNSKEDLLEFIILCSNRIENIGYLQMFTSRAATLTGWNNIWLKKLEALEAKSKIAMKNDSETFAEAQRIIAEGKEKIKQNQARSRMGIIIAVAAVALFILSLVLGSNA